MNSALGRLEATQRFYSVILSGCGNPVIGEISQGQVARINFLRARSMSRDGRSRQSAVEMWRIFNAIEKRKPSEARQAAVDHIKAAAEAAREAYDESVAQKLEAGPKTPPRRSARANSSVK